MRKNAAKKRKQPGPDPELLKIELDPAEGIRRLLRPRRDGDDDDRDGERGEDQEDEK